MGPNRGDPLRYFLQSMVFGFLGSVSLYISAWHQFDLIRDQWTGNRINVHDTFDFIVVGSGSAGAVVANRLSENFQVLLLEAGGEPYPLSAVPAFSLLQLNHPEIDWMHRTVPQKDACKMLSNNEASWSQGKGLGGTSNLNLMVWSRGHPEDYAKWAEITGDESWNYDGVLPYFKKAEDFHGDYSNSSLHATGGPIRIDRAPYNSSGKIFVDAAQELGYPQADLNGRFTEGFDLVYSNIKFGRRHGAYEAYIRPARRRRNLTIIKFARVNKVLLRGENNDAYGVQYDRHGQYFEAYARKEVIISAGVVNTPKILMLSGIGPREHLEEMKIPVKVDAPVGENLQDHVSTFLGPFFVDDSFQLADVDKEIKPQSITEYLLDGTGLLASPLVHAMGFICSSYAKARGEGGWPDIQMFFNGVSFYKGIANDMFRAANIKSKDYANYSAHAAGRNSFAMVVSLARPRQRGVIRLTRNGPYSPLRIDPKYLQDPEDVKVLVEGVKRAIEIIETTPSFKKFNAHFTNQSLPGCENVTFRSDDYWECYVRHISVSLSHIVGTAAMGAPGSKSAVVDPLFQVIGTKRLRVVDNSVIPLVPAGNTNAPAVMLGERGAETIKRIWVKPPDQNSNSSITTPSPTTEAVPTETSSTAAPQDEAPEQKQKLTSTSVNEVKYRPPLQCKYGHCISV